MTFAVVDSVVSQIGEAEGPLDASQLEGFFRGSLLKLQFSEACLKPLPNGEPFGSAPCKMNVYGEGSRRAYKGT